ncbi:MAG: hypothetical protein AB1458_16335 [Bacteroidota bacterium]
MTKFITLSLVAASCGLAAIAFVSCQKEAVPQQASLPGNSTVGYTDPKGPKALATLTTQYEFILNRNVINEWHCPEPKDNCTKVGGAALSTYQAGLDEAIAQGRVQAYFNGSQWPNMFGFLDGADTAYPGILTGLQNGTYTLSKKTNPGTTDLFYIVHDPANDSDNPANCIEAFQFLPE